MICLILAAIPLGMPKNLGSQPGVPLYPLMPRYNSGKRLTAYRG